MLQHFHRSTAGSHKKKALSYYQGRNSLFNPIELFSPFASSRTTARSRFFVIPFTKVLPIRIIHSIILILTFFLFFTFARNAMGSGSRSSRCFDEEDEDDDEFGRREGTSKKVDLTVRVDNKSGDDLSALTPRSKHSATEQRRRSKINDRFQILRQLLPNGDQKRDKASFLLEVIEYVQFLQEKVQKYESPGWSEENAKLMPWVKVYFRSLWKDARNNNQVPSDGMPDPSQIIKNGSASGYGYLLNENVAMENPVQANYAYVERGHNVAENEARSISDIDNMASQSQSQWLRPSDDRVNADLLNEQEELTIDEGTINISTVYSQNILNVLNHALESSGIDLSQSTISVNINLGKRAIKTDAATTMSTAKDFSNLQVQNPQVIVNPRAESSGEEAKRAQKRRKEAKV